MTERVHWTCPGCGKKYAVPSIKGLTYCPSCLAVRSSSERSDEPDAETPINVGSSRQPPASAHLPRTVPRNRFLVTLAVSIIACFAGGYLVASRSAVTPVAALGRVERPVVTPKPTDPDKALVEMWLKLNLDDGSWEEVRWWPAFDQRPILEQLAQQVPLFRPRDGNAIREDMMKMIRYKLTYDKVARLRFRTKNRLGAMQIEDDIFGIEGDSVVCLSKSDNITDAGQKALEVERPSVEDRVQRMIEWESREQQHPGLPHPLPQRPQGPAKARAEDSKAPAADVRATDFAQGLSDLSKHFEQRHAEQEQNKANKPKKPLRPNN